MPRLAPVIRTVLPVMSMALPSLIAQS